MPAPTEFSNVTVVTKANLYFDGRVASHTVRLADGSRKTLGLIFPGRFHFDTGAAERMEIVAGECRVTLPGASEPRTVAAGGVFEIGAHSGFDIEVTAGVCEYVCTFLG